MEKAKIYDQHLENGVFRSNLDFYKTEIQFLENRLGEVSSKNNSAECLKDLEHFQNQLIIQKNNIDVIRHEVVLDEDRLMKEAAKNEIALQHRSTEFHSKEKEDFEEILQMRHDEFHLMLDGSLLKHRKISEHNYSRAWVPVEADPKATEIQVAIERPPNADR